VPGDLGGRGETPRAGLICDVLAGTLFRMFAMDTSVFKLRLVLILLFVEWALERVMAICF